MLAPWGSVGVGVTLWRWWAPVKERLRELDAIWSLVLIAM